MDGGWGAAGQCRRVAPRGRADATVTNRWGVTAQVCCALQRSHRRPVPDQSQDSWYVRMFVCPWIPADTRFSAWQQRGSVVSYRLV